MAHVVSFFDIENDGVELLVAEVDGVALLLIASAEGVTEGELDIVDGIEVGLSYHDGTYSVMRTEL